MEANLPRSNDAFGLLSVLVGDFWMFLPSRLSFQVLTRRSQDFQHFTRCPQNTYKTSSTFVREIVSSIDLLSRSSWRMRFHAIECPTIPIFLHVSQAASLPFLQLAKDIHCQFAFSRILVASEAGSGLLFALIGYASDRISLVVWRSIWFCKASLRKAYRRCG